MSDGTDRGRARPPGRVEAQAARRERLAQALRDNLRRRKAQRRPAEGAENGADDGDGTDRA